MEDNITPSRIANAIMQDQRYHGIYLAVEGKKDLKLFRKFVSSDDVEIKVAFGCEKVKEVLKILEDRGFDRVVGIIDRDFKEIQGEVDVLDRLFLTDHHDIEVMMINSSSLDHVLSVCCNSDRIKSFEEKNGTDIRNTVLELGKEVGYLKLANKIHNLGLLFKPDRPEGNVIKYRDFICDKTLDFKGEEKLINSVVNYSRNRSKNMKNTDEIKDCYCKVCSQSYDLNQISNGHDLSNILLILMSKVLKSGNKLLANYNAVEDLLIIGYEYSEFKDTNLFKNMDKWSQSSGFRIFK